MNPSTQLERVTLAHLKLHRVSRASLLDVLGEMVHSRQSAIVTNINVHAFNTAWQDLAFRRVINESELVFVDGFGITLGGRIAGIDTGERLTPADWIDDFLLRCRREAWPVFWLGDTDEVGEAFERHLATKHPDLILAGRHHGFFEKTGSESADVVSKINHSGARVLMVGMSMPIQEKWLAAHRAQLRPLLAISLGGLARIKTGHIRRGPRWMTDHGLEWLYRLCVQPAYTWRRYLIGNPLFLARVIGFRFLGLKPPCGTDLVE